MGKKKQNGFVDDGRTIADMNVDGMPWYATGKKPENPVLGQAGKSIDLSRKEKAAMMKGVLSAALLVALIFAAAFTLFLLFCVYVWFA